MVCGLIVQFLCGMRNPCLNGGTVLPRITAANNAFIINSLAVSSSCYTKNNDVTTSRNLAYFMMLNSVS